VMLWTMNSVGNITTMHGFPQVNIIFQAYQNFNPYSMHYLKHRLEPRQAKIISPKFRLKLLLYTLTNDYVKRKKHVFNK
jgi:hypothetical protein